MTRFDPFGQAHSGLRAALFDAATALGCSDFADPPQAECLAARVREALALLREHHAGEDRVLLAAIAEHCPDLAAGLRREHARCAVVAGEVEALLQRTTAATAAEREVLGVRVRSAWHGLLARELELMEREEVEGNRVLRAHRDDDELASLSDRVLSSIGPVRRTAWCRWILPALPARARAAFARRWQAMEACR